MDNELKTKIIDIPWISESEIMSQRAFVRVLNGTNWDEALEDLIRQLEIEEKEMGYESNLYAGYRSSGHSW